MSWVLPRIVGSACALDLLLSGRIVLGDAAAAIGLVDHAVPGDRVLEEALACARDVAGTRTPSRSLRQMT
jgi:enoyl-CoA hydratase/carnithine racemase